MNWQPPSDNQIQVDAPLGSLTSFGLGGRAKYMATPCGDEALAALLDRAADAELPVKLLGAGANVLVRDDGFDGLVVRLDDPSFKQFEIKGNRVVAGAGMDLMKLVQSCCRAGLAGMEGLAGIPGTVGGAIRMNAGGRYGEIGDVVETVDVIETGGGRRRLTRAEVGFAYRRTALSSAVVTGAVFTLQQQDPAQVYARFKEYWQIKKASQPLADHSAGCIFTNPPGESAGRLIDQAGLKGATCGRARVSTQHANFIVADRGATAGDVLTLIDRVRDTVARKSGTELELEIDVW